MADKNVSFTIAVQDAASAALKSIENAASSLTDRLFSLRAIFEPLLAIAAGFSFASLFQGAVEAAGQFEDAFARLKLAIENTGGDFDALKPRIDAVIQALSQQTVFKPDQLAEGLNTLIQVSGNASGSINALGLATDIAAAKHMDLDAAATLVGRVMDGNTSMLKRYGIVLDGSSDAMSQLQARFGGFAAQEGQSLLGQMQRIKNAFDEFLVALGQAITGTPTFTDATGALITMLTNMEAWVRKNEDAIGDFMGVIGAIGKVISDLVFYAATGLAAIALAFEYLGAGFRGLADEGMIGLGTLLKYIGDWVSNSEAFFSRFGISLDGVGDKLANLGQKWITSGMRDMTATDDFLAGKISNFSTAITDYTQPGAAAGGTLPPPPPTETQIAAWASLKTQLAALEQTTEDAEPKSAKFAAAIAAWTSQAIAARLPGGELTAGLSALNSILAAMRLAEATAALKPLRTELEKLEQTTEDATPKSVKFAEAVTAWTAKAMAAKMPAGELATGLRDLNDILAGMQHDEMADAMDKLGLAFTKLSDGAVPALEREIEATITPLEKAEQLFKDSPDQLQAYVEALDQLKAGFAQLKTAVAESVAEQQRLAQMKDDLASLEQNGAAPDQIIVALLGDLDELTNKANDLRQLLADMPDQGSKAAQEYQKELASVNAEIATLDTKLVTVTTDIEKAQLAAQKQALDLAKAWIGVGDAIIGAAEKMGILGSTAASVGKDVLSLGTSVAEILSGDVLQGAAGLIGSVGSLIGSLFGGKAKADPQQVQIVQENTAALVALSGKIGLLGIAISGTSLGLAQAGARTIAAGGTTISSDQMIAFEAAAKALGITLGTTIESWQQAAQAILGVGNALSKFGADFQSQMDQMDAYNQIFAVTNPAQMLGELAAAAGSASPAILNLIQGLNLADPGDLEILRQRIQALFTELEAGGQGLTTEQLGGLQPSDIIDILEKLIAGLNGVEAAADPAAAALAKLTAAEQQLQMGFQILGTNASDQATQSASLYGFNIGDITTAAGRDAAIASLQALYQQDPADTQKAQEILNVIKELQAITFATDPAAPTTGDAGSIAGDAAASAGGSIAGATQASTAVSAVVTDRTALMLVDIQRSALTTLNRIADRLDKATLGVGAAPGAAAGGGVTNNFSPTVQVGPLSPKEIVAEIGREINIYFGDLGNKQLLQSGSVAR